MNGNDQYNKNPYWDLYKNSNTSDKDVFRFTGKAIWNINIGIRVCICGRGTWCKAITYYLKALCAEHAWNFDLKYVYLHSGIHLH